MSLRDDPGFLGTHASMLADLTLLAYILLLLPLMIAGFIFARRRMFEPQHKLVMTFITLFNWVLILFVMVSSYTQSVAPNVPAEIGDRNYLIPTLHLITGGLAQILATYLLIRMWFENYLPEALKIKRLKPYMRSTLGLWLVTILLGVILYMTWYTPGPVSADDPQEPVATVEPSAVEEPPVVTEQPDTDDDADDAEVTDDDDVDDIPEPVVTEEQ